MELRVRAHVPDPDRPVSTTDAGKLRLLLGFFAAGCGFGPRPRSEPSFDEIAVQVAGMTRSPSRSPG